MSASQDISKHAHRPRRYGFTLVEVLTVMIIISLMGGMVVTAVQGVSRTVKESRTRSIINAIDNVIQEQYESYKYRPLPVEIPDLYRPSSLGTNDVGFEVLATEAARARLIMTRDLQRMEMPDRLADIRSAPVAIRAACNPVIVTPPPIPPAVSPPAGTIVNTRSDPASRRVFPVNWYDSNASFTSSARDNVPGKLAAYRTRIDPAFNFTAQQALENQGAECLYLIMANAYVAGTPAIEAIPNANIDDTDGDGLLEILDGWGQPLGFIRWPIAYEDPDQALNTATPDDFDLFRSDFAFVNGVTSSIARATNVVPTPDVTGLAPWSVRPLIISRGDDGEFGIALNPFLKPTMPGGLMIEDLDFNYLDNAESNWPRDAAHMGAELLGRASSSYRMIDPYMREFIEANRESGQFAGLLPGQDLPGTNEDLNRADNITNYGLQVSR